MRYLLIWFMTLSMGGIYYPAQTRVTEVDRNVVTMECEGRNYTIEGAEAWRVGDRAECIFWTRGTERKDDDVIVIANYIWRIR